MKNNLNLLQNDNCTTGDENHLYPKLKKAFEKAKEVNIIVAFLMESGINLLIEDLSKAVNNGIKIKILCGNYLNITHPKALYIIKSKFGDDVDLRFYAEKNKSFHPKAYIFKYDNYSEIFIGSSNLSYSALTVGIEWNYKISSIDNYNDFIYFKEKFDNLFLNNSIIIDDVELRKYSKNWKRTKFFKTFESSEDDCNDNKLSDLYQPNEAQIEALYHIDKARKEGLDKVIVVAATGVGKTFIASFDSKEYKKVLFIAHREEIIKQAQLTFSKVRSDESGLLYGKEKNIKNNIVFALINTISNDEYLNEKYFKRDQFDYIVIDEFHHAVANSYQNVINYFTPKFLLGLTATPERFDNEDVFAICDYNLVYEVRMREAINKGWLAPFRYYGIYDDTDYNKVEYKNGKYNEKQLEKALFEKGRCELVLKNYKKYYSTIALGFCATKKHALEMARFFDENSIPSCCVISGCISDETAADTKILEKYKIERNEAIRKLKNGEIKVIFSVDIFNEGVDIKEIDLIMFLRPTQSPTIYLQQLGRGLRKDKNKKYLNVLDFIGNYKKANLVPFLLSSRDSYFRKTIGEFDSIRVLDEEDFPEDCLINFDLELINLFKRFEEAEKKIDDKILEEYLRIEDYLGRKVYRLDFYTYINWNIYIGVKKYKKKNPFKDYLCFLSSNNRLSEEEKLLIGTIAHKFLIEIENTLMSKMYKIHVLMAFYNNGKIKMKIQYDDLYKSYKNFYSNNSYAEELKNSNNKNFKILSRSEYIKSSIYTEPIKALRNTLKDYFYKLGDDFYLNDELEYHLENIAFIKHFKDIIDFKTRSFLKERLEKKFESI